ncbi:MAG: pyridoxamine 5'-phosphate oxidase family protein [Magnetovibrio sp.]|nr:pyridoxamine 5'-phosphate oxidase family protein [Magnetovibrio sp.]
MTDPLNVTDRTRLRRSHERGHFDRKTIYAILDAMPMCHVGLIQNDKPIVIPTIQWREGDHVYWHGSNASRSLKTSENADVCLTVSLLDGMVMARSAMHHSVNFRSVMIFGRPTMITDPAQKAQKLDALIEALYPGRVELLRPMSEQEVKATAILSMPIEEASAKIRSGGPVDDDEDYALPIWAGVLPIQHTVGAPQADPRNLPTAKMPDTINDFKIG